VELTTLQPCGGYFLEIWKPQPLGTLRACPVLYRDSFTFTYLFGNSIPYLRVSPTRDFKLVPIRGMKAYRGRRNITPSILKLGAR